MPAASCSRGLRRWCLEEVPVASDEPSPLRCRSLTLQELVHAKLADADDAIEKEAAKGYSIAFVGIEQPISVTANHFRRSASASGRSVRRSIGDRASMARVPLPAWANRSIFSCPPAVRPKPVWPLEIALALAKASGGTLTALHVFDPQDDTELLRGRARRQGLSVLVDARRLGKRSGVPVKGITRYQFEA